MDIDMPCLGSKDSFATDKERIYYRGIRLGASEWEEYFSCRLAASEPDLLPRTLALWIEAISRRLFRIGLCQALQDLRQHPIIVVAFK